MYKSKGKIKVDKDIMIWDNRYVAGDEEIVPQIDENGTEIKATTFDGGKKFYSGMLIRQIK